MRWRSLSPHATDLGVAERAKALASGECSGGSAVKYLSRPVPWIFTVAIGMALAACDYVEVPVRMTDVHVQVAADGSCSIEHIVVACSDVGQRLGRIYPRHDCNIIIDVDRHATYDHVGSVRRNRQMLARLYGNLSDHTG